MNVLLKSNNTMTSPNVITPSTNILDGDGRDWTWAFAIFRDIDDAPGYCIGSNQTLWSRYRIGPPYGMSNTWRRMKPYVAQRGHLTFTLRGTAGSILKVFLHRLMLEAFISDRPSGLECCHNNGIPTDNRLENLRWDTRTSNIADALDHGAMPVGSRRSNAKMTESQVKEARRRQANGESRVDLAAEYGVSYGVMCGMIRGDSWNHIDRAPKSHVDKSVGYWDEVFPAIAKEQGVEDFR